MSSVAKKSHWPLSILSGMVSLLNLLLPLILVRILTPDEVGRYKVFFLYLVLVPWLFLTAGVTNGLGHFAGQDEQLRRKTFRSSWTLLLIFATVIGVAGALGHELLARFLGWGSDEAAIFVVGAVLTVLGTFYEETLIASGQIWKGAAFSSGFEFLRTTAILVAALHFRSILAVFWAHVFGLSLKVVFGYLMSFKEGVLKPLFDRAVWKSVLRYATPVSFAAALQILTNYADQIFLSRALPSGEFAVYTLGCLAIPPLAILEQAVNRVNIPRLSRLFATGQNEAALHTHRDMISELAWMLIPASIGLSVFSEAIIELLFTARYLESAKYLRVFAFSYMFWCIPYDAVFRARGDAGKILGRLVFYSSVSLTAVLVGAHFLGSIGALFGALVGLAVMRFSAIVAIHSSERWRYRDMLPWADLARYFTWAAAASVFALLTQSIFQRRVHWLLCSGLGFTFIYMVGTVATFLRRRGEFHERPPVLLLTQYLGLGGLERMILNLGRGLQAEGHYTPLVLVYDQLPGNPTLHGQFVESGIEVFTLSKSSGLSLKVALKVAAVVIRRAVPVVHSHDLGALIYAVLAKFITLGGVRIVHTQHSFIHLEKAKRYAMYERFFTYFVDEITTVSESLKVQYPTVGIDNSNIEVVSNGVEYPKAPVTDPADRRALRKAQIAGVSVPAAKAILEANIERPWVLCMARIHPKKGQDHVIELWRRLPASTRSKALLVLVGQETFAGQLAKIQHALDSLGEGSQAIYVGFTQHPIPWLKACEISVSGSEFEGMPLGPVEAVGSGLQLLVSDIPGHGILPDFVPRFPLNDYAAGAAVLTSYIETAAIDVWAARKSAWEQGKSFRTDLGIQAMTRKYEKSYGRALNAGTAKSLPPVALAAGLKVRS